MPNTSPISGSTGPYAAPTRTSGTSVSSWMVAAIVSAISAPVSGVSALNSTSSPSVFTSRPPRDATMSAAVSSNHSTTRASSISSSSRLTCVNDTMSANPTVVIGRPAGSPFSRVAAVPSARVPAAASCRRQACTTSGSNSPMCFSAISTIVWTASADDASFASCGSMLPSRLTCHSASLLIVCPNARTSRTTPSSSRIPSSTSRPRRSSAATSPSV